MQPLRKRGKKS